MTVQSDRPIDSARAPLAATVLGWAGVVPFAAGAIGPLVVTDLGLAALIAFATSVYGALVLSFLGGIRWGMLVALSVERFGHYYVYQDYINGWAALTDPPDWSDDRSEALKAVFAKRPPPW